MNYARNHYTTSSELCAGFVARSIQEGGIPIAVNGNRVVTYFERSLVSQGFEKHKLKRSGKNIYYSENKDNVAVGDVILWYCPVGVMNSKGKVFNWMHAAIVTKIDNDRIYITQTNGRHCDLLAEKITVCDHAFDLYSYHWPQNTGTPYKVNFDANGGTCSTASKTVYSPGKFGTLPEPVPPTINTEWLKTQNKFIGWFTSKDDYGTQVTADSNVQLNSDTTLYARYGTGFTGYESYWKAPGVLHIDVDNVEHYPAYRIAAFRGNEYLKDAVILDKIIYADNLSFDLDIRADKVPYNEEGFKYQLVPAKADGTCLFTPEQVTGSYDLKAALKIITL